jgi:CheY-like chemotaxis protein
MGITVIITDDDPVAIFLLTKIVKNSGLSPHPLGFLSAEETLAYLIENNDQGQIYLILLDINMPGMDGWDFLESLKNLKFSKDIYVVMVSSSVDLADRRKADTYGNVIGYLEKPVKATALMDLCNNSFSREVLN